MILIIIIKKCCVAEDCGPGGSYYPEGRGMEFKCWVFPVLTQCPARGRPSVGLAGGSAPFSPQQVGYRASGVQPHVPLPCWATGRIKPLFLEQPDGYRARCPEPEPEGPDGAVVGEIRSVKIREWRDESLIKMQEVIRAI